MKILLLSDPASPHTIKWATSLAQKDIDIGILGFSNLDHFVYDRYSNIKIFSVGLDWKIIRKDEGNLAKIRYLKALPILRQIIKKFSPDILHAHYASSYGLLGALSGFHPYIISVWGTDIFRFPNISIIHKKIIEFSLSNADRISSTSHIMAVESQKYTDKHIDVIPFGIDLNVFKPMEVESLFSPSDIVIGTVKSLEEKYGIEYLIRAFKILSDKHRNLPLKLLIVGGGSLEENLKKLVTELNIFDKALFAGKIPYDHIQKYHNMLSVYVALSNIESFGVSVIEANACAKPVVVSDVGGLPEIVENGVNGFVVPPRNPEKLAEALEKIILNRELMRKMGQAGRKKVETYYDWNKTVEQMINIYSGLLNKD